MRRLFLTLSVLCITIGAAAMSKSKIRTSARFLTDRMAYELDLTPRQYDDFYEINYDFLYEANLVMDDVMRGYRDAIYYYYELLDRRNEDASYVLNYYQYSRFMDADYFYRPIFNAGGRWNLRIYVTYSNHKFYYYDAPRHYKTYRGEHGRRYYSKGYYSGRYKKQDRYTGRMRISGSRDFGRSLKNDFGVNVRDRGRENRYNNYDNPNRPNRTQDERHRDVNSNRGNSRQPQTSPQTSTRPGRGNRTESTSSTRRNDNGTRTENSNSTRRNDNGTRTESTRNSGGSVTRTGRR
ncbi:MAG: hypothetical protein MR534_03030 [Prevotellaceae bacterium]|nr:hypothetical protein [Prevotellaceae bacterium]MDD7657842.1 hypothetical protein [Prevotellaceae bacterium]